MASKPDKGKDPLVKIAVAPDEIVAQLWRDALEENGIHSMLKSASFLQVIQTAPGIGHYELYVLASDVKKALEVLEPFMEEDEREI